MVMTSVSGRLLGYEFTGSYHKWYGCHPLSLFDASISKQCLDKNYVKIKRNLEREVSILQRTDYLDRLWQRGGNIDFEIIQVCQAVKPNIHVYR